MKVFRKTFEYQTKGQFDFIDVTDDIAAFLEDCEAQDGLVHVYCPHTTVAIKINEEEEGFNLDFKDFMSELVPKTRYYRHNDLDIRDEKTLCEDISLCVNGDSHILQMLVGSASETIPLHAGKMALGKWQRIFMVEVDKARPRRIEVSVMTAQPVEVDETKTTETSAEKARSLSANPEENISVEKSVTS
jgi:secondary thiamine-phosphate synthase enzyme